MLRSVEMQQLCLTGGLKSERNEAMMTPSLRERLAILNFRQEDLAKAADLNRRTINDLVHEKRRRGPHPVVARAIEKALTEHELKVRDYLISIHGVPNGE